MSSSSQSSASASLVERIQFSSERDAVLARRDSLALDMGADTAHAWVMDLGAAVDRLRRSPLAGELDKDVELWALVRDAHNVLIRFATREWAQRVPWFMLDAPLCDIVASLPA
ncbi:hypothetical protein BJV77DRAFT_965802, partial [Russula vinacea]